LLYRKDAFAKTSLQLADQNLERLKRQQWLEEFPRGSQLLTYLYRILLVCEADVDVAPLVRTVFERAA